MQGRRGHDVAGLFSDLIQDASLQGLILRAFYRAGYIGSGVKGLGFWGWGFRV